MRTHLSIVLAGLLVFVAGVSVGRSQVSGNPRMRTDVLLDTTTGDLPRRARVLVNLDHWDSGAETGRHRHPGPTVIVVLEGELSEVAGGRTNVLTGGRAYWRPAGEEHDVRNLAGRPARALAVHLDPAAGS